MSDFSVDVLLGHSYFLVYDPKQFQKMRPYPPLATLYAAAYLGSAGYSVALFDAMLTVDARRSISRSIVRSTIHTGTCADDSFAG